MAVLNVDLKADGRQVKQKFSGQWRTTIWTTTNGSNTSTTRKTSPVVTTSGTVVYVVDVSDKYEQPITILQDRRLPQLADNYVEGGVVYWGVYFVDATPRFVGMAGNLYRWEITYTLGGEFSNAPQQNDDETEQSETLLDFSASIELEDVAGAVDLDGNFNANSLGEFFADPLVYKSGVLNLSYKRRENSNPLALLRDYSQKVNAAAWYGFAAGCVKVSNISFSASVTTNGTAYDVDYLLQYRPSGWAIKKANSGLYYKSGATIYRATNDDGSPTDTPVLLALDGSRLAAGAAVPMKSYRVNGTADLYALGLPDPFDI